MLEYSPVSESICTLTNKAIGKPDSTGTRIHLLGRIWIEDDDYQQMERRVCSLEIAVTTKLKERSQERALVL